MWFIVHLHLNLKLSTDVQCFKPDEYWYTNKHTKNLIKSIGLTHQNVKIPFQPKRDVNEQDVNHIVLYK